MATDRGGESPKASRAITDLIDERGYFLAQSSLSVRAAWTIAGLVIIAITGLLGYTATPVPFDIVSLVLGRAPHIGPQYDIDWPFLRPWLLYIWLGGLIITLQAMVLRHPSLQQQRRATLLTTVVCMIVTALLYYYRSDIVSFLQHLWDPSSRPPDLLKDPSTYALINYAILLGFIVETLWIASRGRITRGPSAFLDLKTGQKVIQSKSDLPSPAEQITGYLVSRGALLLLVSVFMSKVVPGIIAECNLHAVTIAGTCSSTDSLLPLWELDIDLALPAIIVGLVMLGLIVGDYAQRRLAQRGVSYTYVEYGEEFVRTLLDTLLARFRDRAATSDSRTTPRIPSSLRYLVWPALLFVATLGAALLSQGLQWYLHSPKLSDNVGDIGVLTVLNYLYQYEVVPLGLALLGILLLIVGVVLAMAVRLASWHVASDMLRFLLRIGGTLLVTFGIYSLALLAFNQLLRVWNGCYSSGVSSDVQTFCQQSRSHPFDPGVMTALSILVVLVFFGMLVRRRFAHR
jgi:hypothetical protein